MIFFLLDWKIVEKDYDLISDFEKEARLKKYLEAYDALQNLLELPTSSIPLTVFDSNIVNVNIIRVGVITKNPIFPIEWRDEASATFLPEELPIVYQKWRNYIEDIKNSKYRGFLYDLFLYDNYKYCEINDILAEIKIAINHSL